MRSSLVARRSSLVLALGVVGLAAPTLAAAEGLTANVRMAVAAEANPAGDGYHKWSLWAERDDGHLISLHDRGANPNQLPYWVDRGLPAGASPGSQGVSAVGWGSNGDQRAFFIDEPNNRVVRYVLGGICPAGCVTTIAPPLNPDQTTRILTGHFVANVRRNANGAYTELLFARSRTRTAVPVPGSTSPRSIH